MSKRVNNKKGNRVRRRNPFQKSKIRSADIETVAGQNNFQIFKRAEDDRQTADEQRAGVLKEWRKSKRIVLMDEDMRMAEAK